ncbi:Leucine Rich repeats (2 copies) [compost metagenome]
MKLYTDPRGEAYRQIIDVAIGQSEVFVLGEKLPFAAEQRRYTDVMDALAPYLVKTIVVPEGDMEELMKVRGTYNSHAFYTMGTCYFYRCCEESGELLKRLADRLADWIFPNLPEDLCFLKKDGGDFLYSVVHEHIYGIDVTEEEAVSLMGRITGLFLELPAHRDLDRLLDDAIRHKTDWLYLSGHRMTELPERIGELSELRELEIFEQDLYRLPEELFECSKLERLSIMTADLEGIPASIGKLKQLKTLSIQCASSDRPAPGFKVKPKDEIGLNRIPPEIGELEQLEQLTIHYSAIRELPPEMVKLKQLRSLDLGMCMIPRRPEFLETMEQLTYINLSRDSLWEMSEEEELEE